MFPPGFEPGTFRVLGERDNHYTTETAPVVLWDFGYWQEKPVMETVAQLISAIPEGGFFFFRGSCNHFRTCSKGYLALAGNRTRASRVAGENSTTEPPMHALCNLWAVFASQKNRFPKKHMIF